MKKMLAILIAAAMLISGVAALADAPRYAVALAQRYVPEGARLSSTGEDDTKLELTFLDKADNQYMVVLHKSPLYLIRVNMKSTDESGGK